MKLDRLNRYRIAALILLVSVIRTVYTSIMLGEFSVWRLFLWVGFLVLLVAVVADYMEVWTERKKITNAIEDRVKNRDAP